MPPILQSGIATFALVLAASCDAREPLLPILATPDPVPSPVELPAIPQGWSVDGFAGPGAVVWDERSDLYLVSNANGGAHDLDDDGFIARVSPPPDARIVDLAWIDGASSDVTLHAPKGMALAGDLLYVVDVGAVRMFDRLTGAPRGVVDMPGLCVGDIVAPSDEPGVAYVTVTGLERAAGSRGRSAIWKIDQGVARPLASGPQLGGASGLAIAGGALVVVGFDSGELFRLVDGRRTQVEKLPAGGLDGVAVLPDGRFAVSSWSAAGVFVGGGGLWRKEPWTLPSPADLGVDTRRGLLLVPSLDDDRVEMHAVTPP